MKKSRIEWEHCFRAEDSHLQTSFNPENLARINSKKASEINSRFAVVGANLCYIADSKETAIAEKLYWLDKFYQSGNEKKPRDIEVSLLDMQIDREAEFCDIRGMKSKYPKLYDRNDYRKSQAFAKQQYEKGEKGIIYDSVRHKGGQCAAVFAKKKLKSVVMETIVLHWNGESLSVK